MAARSVATHEESLAPEPKQADRQPSHRAAMSITELRQAPTWAVPTAACWSVFERNGQPVALRRHITTSTAGLITLNNGVRFWADVPDANGTGALRRPVQIGGETFRVRLYPDIQREQAVIEATSIASILLVHRAQRAIAAGGDAELACAKAALDCWIDGAVQQQGAIRMGRR